MATKPGWGSATAAAGGVSRRSKDELFKRVSVDTIKPNMKIGLWGPSKVGKTRVIMEMATEALKAENPEPSFSPVYVLDTEFNTDTPYKIIAKACPAADIRIIHCRVGTTGNVGTDAIASLELYEEALVALADIDGGVVALDSATDLWQWITLRLRTDILKIDPSARVAPSDYSWANTYYKKLMLQAKAINAHMVMTAHSQEVFRDAKLTPTGVYKPVWQKESEYYTHMEIRLDFPEQDQYEKGIYNSATIKGSRYLPMYNKKYMNLSMRQVYNDVKRFL